MKYVEAKALSVFLFATLCIAGVAGVFAADDVLITFESDVVGAYDGTQWRSLDLDLAAIATR